MQQKEILATAESLSPEEQQKYISEQIKKLQDQFQLKPQSCEDSHSQGCSGCPSGPNMQGPPSMGSVMSSDEQLQFFKSLKG